MFCDRSSMQEYLLQRLCRPVFRSDLPSCCMYMSIMWCDMLIVGKEQTCTRLHPGGFNAYPTPLADLTVVHAVTSSSTSKYVSRYSIASNALQIRWKTAQK